MAKIQITNDYQLQNLLNEAMYKAVEYTMVKIFQENSDLIDKYVYAAYTPEYYDRTGEFRDAWNYRVKRTSDHHNVLGTRGRNFGEFYYDPGVMEYHPDKAQHGTPSGSSMMWDTNSWAWLATESAWGDARDYLADILYEGKGGKLFGDGPWTKKRNAWGALINKLDRGKIFTWFEESMAKQGLKMYKR